MTVRMAARRGLAGFVTVAGIIVAAAAAPTESVESGATTWSQSLSTPELLEWTRPDRLAGIPIDYRRAVFHALRSAEERVEFWRRPFRSYRETHVLSPGQHSALARAEALLTPEWFGEPLSETRRAVLIEVHEAVAGALGTEAALQLFQSAGRDLYATAALPVAERLRYAWRTGRSESVVRVLGYVVPALRAASCNCNKAYGDCYYYQNCGCGPYACDPTTWGCGRWWLEPCDALCSYDECGGIEG